MMVEFFSAEMVLRVCRYLSCRAVGDSEMAVKVVMGSIKTTLHHLQTMKEGDMLFFKKPELAHFMANGVPSFGVNIGTRGSNVAVRIEKQLVPGHN